MMKKWMVFIAWFGMGIGLLAAQSSPKQLLQAGHNAYHDKDYETAISRYEALRADGYESVVLYYNLGNAYYRNGNLPMSVLNYERALRLDPANEQVQSNLALVQEQLEASNIQIRQSGVVRTWLSVQHLMRTRGWAVLGLLLFWLGVGGLAVWQFAPQRRQRKAGFLAGITALLLCLLPFGFAYGRAQQEFYHHKAVLMAEETPLHVAPDAQSEPVLTLYGGETLTILDEISGWYKVELSDTTVGWLPKDLVAEV
ncbi:SH3 domain-containing protein [Phaeodactylibacter xiamenensis]|uniref:SH3 domain-containing protein n=1 Tax=Phaeodactylibacter xiamenensis TaxID=1524460 RepID=UPI003CCB896A